MLLTYDNLRQVGVTYRCLRRRVSSISSLLASVAPASTRVTVVLLPVSVTAVASILALARARHLDHLLALLQLLELHLLLLLRLLKHTAGDPLHLSCSCAPAHLLALALLHHGLVDERLPVCGLQDLLPVLYLDDLLAALHLGHGQHLDLLGADLLAPLQLHLAPCSLHVLHDDLLAGSRLYHLLTLACRNHPDNKQILSSLSSQAIFN